jgi:hypothetical protein
MLEDARIWMMRRAGELLPPLRSGCHFATAFLMGNLSAPHKFGEAKTAIAHRQIDHGPVWSLAPSAVCFAAASFPKLERDPIDMRLVS